MARILFVWELGGGMGHLTPIKQIATSLQKDGHEIFVAAKELNKASMLFDDSNVSLLQAPGAFRQAPTQVKNPQCFSHILYNYGWSDEFFLSGLVRSWKTIFNLVEPEMVIYDHSPTALLASVGQGFKKILFGSGFLCPPPSVPLGVFFPERFDQNQFNSLAAHDDLVRDTANKVLEGLGEKPLTMLPDIYRLVDNTFLTTYEELDHFPLRETGRYFGINLSNHGASPKWPDADGKKAFLYLSDHGTIKLVLDELVRRNISALVYSRELPVQMTQKLEHPLISFQNEIINMQEICNEVDFAVVHANHGTSTQLLLSGVPLVMLPLCKEHLLFAFRVAKAGMGHFALKLESNVIQAVFDQVISDPAILESVRQFAEKYKDCNDSKKLIDVLSSLVADVPLTSIQKLAE